MALDARARASEPKSMPAAPRSVSELTRRTLRTWSCVVLVHALLLVTAAIAWIPWKTSWINAALIGYALAQAASGIGLWRLARWGWRLALATATLGLSCGVAAVAGLLHSWLYLSTVYDEYGKGAALVALLLAAVAFEALGLLPALELRALLRREVRRDFGRARPLLQALAVIVALPVAMVLPLRCHHRMTSLPVAAPDARDEALALARAIVDEEPRPATPALAGVRPGGAVYASLWRAGRLAGRGRGEGESLEEAVEAAARALAGELAGDARGRIKIDRVVGARPLLAERPAVVALSVRPGVEGLRRRSDAGERVLLPDDMLVAARFGRMPLVPQLPEIRVGLDAAFALHALAGPGELERLALESWIEPAAPGGGALEVRAGNTALASRGAAGYRASALAAGRFLVRAQRAEGSFTYVYDPLEDRAQGTTVTSLARHAGVVYGLSQLHRAEPDRAWAEAAERGIAWLIERYAARCGGELCIAQRPYVELGTNAIALVAMLEYQRATGDDGFEASARELAALVVSLQRPAGDFDHRLWAGSGRRFPEVTRMFANEQAALALVLAHEVLGEPRFLAAAARALDYLTGPKYERYLLGWVSYGADHWTCLAAAEAWPRLDEPRYLDFCLGYAAFLRRLQFEPEHEVHAGHYGLSLLVPQAPATAGFTEAVLATCALARRHGRADAALEAQAAAALDALRRDQLRPDNAYLARSPEHAAGGIRRSLVEPEVRIDFVQHAMSALLAGAALFED